MARMAISGLRPVDWTLRMAQRFFDDVKTHELGVMILGRIHDTLRD
jgi:hypothetical protein